MSFVDFAEVKASHPIETLIERLGLTMTRRGEQYRGPCPVCQSGGPRALVITPAKQAFFCFAAKQGGDVISLAAHIRGETIKDAAHWICGEGKPGQSDTVPATVPNENRKGSEERRLLKPLTYLETNHPKLKPLGIASETLEHFGAGYAPKGLMRGRLAIPIHDPDGGLIAYAGQALDESQHPPLIFPKDFDPAAHLFNAHRVREEELTLCRDPVTAIAAWENGIDNVVATLTSEIVPAQLRLLAELMDDRAITTLDLF